MSLAEKSVEKSERSKPEETHVQFQHVVNEKDHAACFRSPIQKGAESLAKAGFPDGEHLLESCKSAEAMSKRSSFSESTPKVMPVGQSIDGVPNGPRLPQNTDYNGKDCEFKAISEKEYPMTVQGDAHGCGYGDDPAVKSVYDEAEKHTIKLTKEGQDVGSGVMVGKDGDICKILVDQHQIDASEAHPGVEVTTPDGNKFPATHGLADPKRDLFLLDIPMSSKSSLCSPAKVADSPPKPGDQLTDVGYPMSSAKSPYASVGSYAGDKQAKDINPEASKKSPDRDPNRTMGQVDATTIGGVSGSGVFNSDGKLVGVMETGTGAMGEEGAYTPVTPGDVADFLNRSKSKH
jgi:S1-C subfamily serine protease